MTEYYERTVVNMSADAIKEIIRQGNSSRYIAVDPFVGEYWMVDESNAEFGGQVIECEENISDLVQALIEHECILEQAEPFDPENLPNYLAHAPLYVFQLWTGNEDGERSSVENETFAKQNGFEVILY